MQWTWLIVMGISIRMGIDVARYAALRAKRTTEQHSAGRETYESANWPNALSPAAAAPVAHTSIAPLAYRWTVQDQMICQWTFNENATRVQPKIALASRRGRAPRTLSRPAGARRHALVN
jgi:hypothetical protein